MAGDAHNLGQDASIARAVQTQVIGYNRISALAFLAYDILITFPQEVAVIWPIRSNATKFLYFFIRYFPLLFRMSIIAVRDPSVTFTENQCRNWNTYGGVATILITLAVDYVLILRIFAVYDRNRMIRLAVTALYVVEGVTMSIGLALSMPKLRYANHCVVIGAPNMLFMYFGGPIAFQAILFGLTAWKFLQAVKAGWGNVPIIQLLMRDGTWAFILLFALLTSEGVLYVFAGKYFDVLFGWMITAFSFCGYRILLNLNRLSRPIQPSTFSTSPDIIFTSHINTGHCVEESSSSAKNVKGSYSRSEGVR